MVDYDLTWFSKIMYQNTPPNKVINILARCEKTRFFSKFIYLREKNQNMINFVDVTRFPSHGSQGTVKYPQFSDNYQNTPHFANISMKKGCVFVILDYAGKCRNIAGVLGLCFNYLCL